MSTSALPPYLPMLGDPIDVLPANDGTFTASVKLDGWRALAEVTTEGVLLRTRGDNFITQLPYLCDSLRALPVGTVLDGEIIDPTAHDGGWNRVQSVCGSKAAHQPSADDPALELAVFDILFLAGHDLRSRRWDERQQALATLLSSPLAHVSLVENFEPTAEKLDEVLEAGGEGLMVKRIDAPYVGGKSGAWSKLKPTADESCEAEIIGFTAGRGKYVGQIGAIIFRLPSGAESKCSGFDDALRLKLTQNQASYIGTVVEVAHWGLTAKGKLRHPTFRRMRPDRSVAEMVASPSPIKTEAAVAAAKPTKPKGRTAVTTTKVPRMRNYKQMLPKKLFPAYASLTAGEGDAYNRCVNGGSGDPAADLAVVRELVEAKLAEDPSLRAQLDAAMDAMGLVYA